MLFRYVGDEPDRLYPSLTTAVDENGEPTAVAPFTVNKGDVVDVAADPGDGRFVTVTAKAAKSAKVLAPDNDPSRAPEVEPVAAQSPTAVADALAVEEAARAAEAERIAADEQAAADAAAEAERLAAEQAAQTHDATPSDAQKEQ